jgi:pimeloyl-ACP methyl ester carboxylesterase
MQTFDLSTDAPGEEVFGLPAIDTDCANGECVFAVSNAADDAGTDPRFGECFYTTGANEIYLGECTNRQSVISGFRFAGIRIPRNTNIARAFLVFALDGPYSSPQRVSFHVQATNNAGAFTNSSRPDNRAVIGGIPTPLWTINEQWELGQYWQSPDITQLIQAVVNRSDWDGNSRAVAIIMRNAGNASGQHRRVIGWERERNTNNTPRLVIQTGTPCYTVQVRLSPPNAGLLSPLPPGNCNNGGGYLPNTSLNLSVTLSPDNPYTFWFWSSNANSGAFSSLTSLATTVRVNANLDITANFVNKTPLILVHGFQGFAGAGYTCSQGVKRYADDPDDSIMGMLPQTFKNDYDVWVAHYTTGQSFTDSLQNNGQCLRNQVMAVSHETGSRQIVLVAHSMGGLVSRACLADIECATRVRALYTLGTPHAGINALQALLMFAFGPNVSSAICHFQPGMCQLQAGYQQNVFGPAHPLWSSLSYTFIGGERAEKSQIYWALKGWPLPTGPEGENDGLIGRNSAVGWTRFADEFPANWSLFSAPRQVWLPTAHFADMAALPGEVGTEQSFPVAPRFLISRGQPGYPNTASFSTASQCVLGLEGKRSVPAECRSAGQGATTSPRLARIGQPAEPQNAASFTGQVTAGQTVTHTAPIDSDGRTTFYLTWEQGTVAFRLTRPDGVIVDPAYAAANPEEVVYSASLTPTVGASSAAFVFTNTLTGNWMLTVEGVALAGGGTAYHTFANVTSLRTLDLSLDAEVYYPGDAAILTARLENGVTGIEGATVAARIQRVSGAVDTILLPGQGNGVYAGSYIIPAEPGLAFVTLSAVGVDEGETFSREADGLLLISTRNAQLAGLYSGGLLDEDGNGRYEALSVEVGVSVTAPATYTVAADLAANGQPVAHAQASASLQAGLNTLILVFSGDELRNAQQNGPYALTNVVVLDRQAADLPTDHAENAWFSDAYAWEIFGSCYTLSASADLRWMGNVSASPAPNCVSALGEQYAFGTSVTLTAGPNPGFLFLGWSGDAPGTSGLTPTLAVSVRNDQTIAAVFTDLQRLQLTALCSPNPATVRVWRVRNPNSLPVAFTWDVYGTSQTGQGTAPAAQNGVAGETTFQTQTVSGANTVRLFVNGVLQDTKASNPNQCP